MLADKALLVCVNISQWGARKHDKRATATVETSHTTEKAVGNYTKKLLPGAQELEEVSRLANSLRKYFREQTLPWMSDGTRIIKSEHYLDFANEFRNQKMQFDGAVASFLAAYPQLRQDAQAKLGDLFSANEYPPDEKLLKAFSCEVHFLPLPDVKDFRAEMSQAEKDSFVAKMKEIEIAAMQDCWTRLHEVVSKAASRLSEPDAMFKNSLIDNIRDLCSLMPKLNVTDDPALESARVAIENIVNGMSPDVMRDNATARDQASRDLQAITDKMGAFMGGV